MIKMSTSQVDKSFLGTGWSFPPEFNRQTRQVKMVSREEDIRQSLMILFSTSPGERIMQPAYGCGLNTMVFESMNESTVTEIKDIIERAILFFEPRIILNRVDLDDSEIYNGLLKIQLEYTIRSTNSRSNMVYPFYFQEGTNIRIPE
jgi:phage baseplate assembly protein W